MSRNEGPRKKHWDRIELFKDEVGDWRWRFLAGNHEKFAASEAYASKANARRAAQSLAARMVHPLDIIEKEVV